MNHIGWKVVAVLYLVMVPILGPMYWGFESTSAIFVGVVLILATHFETIQRLAVKLAGGSFELDTKRVQEIRNEAEVLFEDLKQFGLELTQLQMIGLGQSGVFIPDFEELVRARAEGIAFLERMKCAPATIERILEPVDERLVGRFLERIAQKSNIGAVSRGNRVPKREAPTPKTIEQELEGGEVENADQVALLLDAYEKFITTGIIHRPELLGLKPIQTP